MNETIFSKIIRREIPADIVYEDDDCLVFRDIAPQAPVHVLAIPKKAIRSLDDLAPEDEAIIGHLMMVICQVARDLELSAGYRVITNCGNDGGQEVEHLHFHVLGGRKLTWPPG